MSAICVHVTIRISVDGFHVSFLHIADDSIAFGVRSSALEVVGRLDADENLL